MRVLVKILAEQYPHLKTKIEESWGSADGRKFLIELLSDTRGGTRQGFDPFAAKCIVALLKKHDEGFPEFDKTDDVVIPFRGNVERKVYVNAHSGFFLPWPIKWVIIIICLAALTKQLYKLGVL